LVTMDWFNDVWMKEVFANFMAAKIVNPSFPEINHDLRFYLTHYESAYGIDRTEGANPIRQVLENQREAGSLYGAIIYQKAPIVMRHLERMIGEEPFRDGLREYLMTHQYGNATWPDLIAILDARSERDLRTWSRVWVEATGRPTIAAEPIESEGRITGISVTQSDPQGRGLLWNQETEILVRTEGGTESLPVTIDADQQIASLATPRTTFGFALPGVDGISYAHFELDGTSRDALLNTFATIDDPIHRAAAWSALSESMLAGEVAVDSLLALVIRTVSDEPNELVSARLLGSLSSMFWRYLEPERRAAVASDLEATLWRGVEEADGMSRRATFFNTYVSVAFTPEAIERLRQIWENETDLPGLPLSERNFTNIAQALAVREVPGWHAVLETQRDRIFDPDRRARFTFVMPALSADSAVRDSVFDSFAQPDNRTHEPWVLEAMGFLNHPLRAPSAEHYIYPGLELVEEIQIMGDIFFPLRWLNSLLGGHRSKAAAATVRRFLDERPRYPARLRGKVLQASDGLFRVSGLARLDG
ncbi:MAG: M1 family aminopeptidase, partial [Gemmatimonadales bacterium]